MYVSVNKYYYYYYYYYISKDIIGIYLILAHFQKMWANVFPLSGALKLPVSQLRNGFSKFYTKFAFKNHLQPFGLDGWLKVSYLLDYNSSLVQTVFGNKNNSLFSFDILSKLLSLLLSIYTPIIKLAMPVSKRFHTK